MSQFYSQTPFNLLLANIAPFKHFNYKVQLFLIEMMKTLQFPCTGLIIYIQGREGNRA